MNAPVRPLLQGNYPEIPGSSTQVKPRSEAEAPRSKLWWLDRPAPDLSDVARQLARNPAPPLLPNTDTTHPTGLEWGTAGEARNVSR